VQRLAEDLAPLLDLDEQLTLSPSHILSARLELSDRGPALVRKIVAERLRIIAASKEVCQQLVHALSDEDLRRLGSSQRLNAGRDHQGTKDRAFVSRLPQWHVPTAFPRRPSAWPRTKHEDGVKVIQKLRKILQDTLFEVLADLGLENAPAGEIADAMLKVESTATILVRFLCAVSP
jgi:hypothetical protein